MVENDGAVFDKYVAELDKLNRILEQYIRVLEVSNAQIDTIDKILEGWEKRTENAQMYGAQIDPNTNRLVVTAPNGVRMDEYGPRFDTINEALEKHACIVNRYMDALEKHRKIHKRVANAFRTDRGPA